MDASRRAPIERGQAAAQAKLLKIHRNVESVYVTYYPDLAFPEAADRACSFAELAVKNGVRRLVLLSGRNEEGALQGEQAVRDSGAEWTLVRSSFMNQNFSESFWLEPVLSASLHSDNVHLNWQNPF